MRALTEEQEQAVARREGSLLLAAGAGSGKTSVLVERFVRAVLEDGVAPGRILAITFTERSAGELRQRIRARFLELGQREAARDTEGAFVSTFHGFCARLLRGHPLQAGVEPGFEILEEGLAGRLRMLAFSDALAGFLDGERSEAVDVVAAYGADPLRSMTLGAYAQLRSQGEREPSLPAVESGDAAAVRTAVLISELIDRFGVAYTQRKYTRAALDFDDLELSARALLVLRADIRGMWAERLQMLMVDEFQDTNPRQLEILALLECDNLFTVGDELQSIYGFRHADVELFRERHQSLQERGASLALTRNFRSRPPILAAVERIFAQRMGERFTALMAAREDEHAAPPDEPLVELLLTDKRGWQNVPGDVDFHGLPDATAWRQAEARLLAARIAELVAGGQTQAGEVVVLLRAFGDLPVYESALQRHGLRTLAAIGGFWGHQQVGDLLAWLRTLANPLDELALYSTLASPLVGISSDGLALLAGAARERRYGVWRTIEQTDLRELLPLPDRERLEQFHELLESERASMALHPIGELLRRAIAVTGYESHVRSLAWGERRLANVHKLIRLAHRYETQEGRDLRGFLDHAEHLGGASGGREADAPVPDGDSDAVRLMSIHAAKGLEFAVVCVADLGRSPNLRQAELLVDGPSGRVGLRLQQLGDAEPVSALDYDELSEERRAAQEEEEDRILYVACTRARERLLLGGALDFARWPQSKPGVAPIAWLAPALAPDLPALASSVAQIEQDSEAEGGVSAHPLAKSALDLGGGLLVACSLNVSGAEARTGPNDIVERLQQPSLASATEPSRLALGSPEQPSASGPPQCTPAPLREQPVLVPFTDPDATMSYTSLAELERCGYRYYLERILRLPENHVAQRGEDGGIEARARGVIVHALLESIDFAHPAHPAADEVARVARLVGVRADVPEREEIAVLIDAALRAEPARRLASAQRTHHERAFAFSLGPEHPLVTGVLDLIAHEHDGTSLIVDYKSDRLEGGEDLEQLVQRDYGFQRMIYALAAIEDGAVNVEVAHWFLERPGEWVAVRYAASQREELREQLLARVQRARAGGYAVADEPHRGLCLTCPARGGLCSWGETRTMRAR